MFTSITSGYLPCALNNANDQKPRAIHIKTASAKLAPVTNVWGR